MFSSVQANATPVTLNRVINIIIMVVKSSSAPTSPSSCAPVAPSAADPLRGVHRAKETEAEFGRLKRLVPTISKKETVSKLDVILEAIRYIDQLQDQLVEQISSSSGTPSHAAAAAAAAAILVRSAASGKENTNLKLLKRLRQRHRSE